MHQHDHLALYRGEQQHGHHGRHDLHGLLVAPAAILPFGDLADLADLIIDDYGPDHGLQGAVRRTAPYPDQGVWLDEHPELIAAAGSDGDGALTTLLNLEYLNSYLGVLQSCGEGRLTADPGCGSTFLLPAPPDITATDLDMDLDTVFGL